jgi:hypothetical protein
MKVNPSVKKICDKCKVIRRHGRADAHSASSTTEQHTEVVIAPHPLDR